MMIIMMIIVLLMKIKYHDDHSTLVDDDYHENHSTIDKDKYHDNHVDDDDYNENGDPSSIRKQIKTGNDEKEEFNNKT